MPDGRFNRHAMQVVAAGVETCTADAVAATRTRFGATGALVHITVPPTTPAAAVQHAVRHAMAIADPEASVAVVCTVEAEPASGAKRSFDDQAAACAVYVVVGPPRTVSEDGSSGTHLHDNRPSNQQLQPDGHSGGVDAKRNR